MADYIYLLENRLSSAQKNALTLVRDVAREKGLTVFLVGGAVRDLTSGSPVRDLDVVVQGDALKLKKDIEKAGAVVTGETALGHALFLRFPGGVRLELGSTLRVTYPKPGKPVAEAATILDDLRRRDFTANAMALSLNEGSYGLLMDPLNGVADIENRELRLVSNYGFIEDPIRMVRAARLMARLGWQMDEKTQARYETGKEEGYISAASDYQRGYETEEIVHEEDPLRVLKKLEADGWLQILAPSWTTDKVNAPELERLREIQTQLQLQGIHPEPATANFPLLTAKMSAKDVAELKKSFPRKGFVDEIDALDAEVKELGALLTSKAVALPSQTWKVLHEAKPEVVLAVAFSSKNAAIQARFKSFFGEWPKLRQKVPYALMQEMRITPELPGYQDLVDSIASELMDGKLETVEEQKAFLEPHSPPAPPPTVHVRRPRSPKKDSKGARSRAKKALEAGLDLDSDDEEEDDDALDSGADQDDLMAEIAPLVDQDGDEEKDEEAESEVETPAVSKAPAKAAAAEPQAPKAAPKPASAKVGTAPVATKVTAPLAPAKKAAVTVPAPKPAAKASAPVPKSAVKVAAKPPVKQAAKKAAPVKSLPKKAVSKAPAKKAATVSRPAAKKVVAKKTPAKKTVTVKAATKTVAKGSPKKVAAKAPVKGKPVAKPAVKVSAKAAAKKRR